MVPLEDDDDDADDDDHVPGPEVTDDTSMASHLNSRRVALTAATANVPRHLWVSQN